MIEMKESKDKLKEEYGELIIHDVLNQVTHLKARNQLMKTQITDPEEFPKSFEENEIDYKAIIKMLRNYHSVLTGEKLKYIEVESLLKEVISYFPDLEERSVKVNYSLKDRKDSSLSLFLLADSKLFSVLYTLIDNFRKYGGEKMSEINFHYTDKKNGIEFVLENNGEGISKKLKERIFKKGYAGEGLYLTKKILEGYGFTIKEEGEATKGVRFVIFIPSPNLKSRPKRNI